MREAFCTVDQEVLIVVDGCLPADLGNETSDAKGHDSGYGV
jgi:hypothetical protein